MEFSPINEVAHAIVLLSGTPEKCRMFHPYNNHYVFFGDVLDELRIIGDAPRQMEDEEFAVKMEEAGADPEKAPLLTGVLAYRDMAHGKKATMIMPENRYTSCCTMPMALRRDLRVRVWISLPSIRIRPLVTS